VQRKKKEKKNLISKQSYSPVPHRTGGKDQREDFKRVRTYGSITGKEIPSRHVDFKESRKNDVQGETGSRNRRDLGKDSNCGQVRKAPGVQQRGGGGKTTHSRKGEPWGTTRNLPIGKT